PGDTAARLRDHHCGGGRMLRAGCHVPCGALTRPRRRRIAPVVLLVGLAGLAGGPAYAGDVARGRQYYKKGEAAFAMGDYAAATDLFQRAYEETRRPQLLWNLAAAWRKRFDIDHDAAHLRRARSIYENYANLVAERREQDEARR